MEDRSPTGVLIEMANCSQPDAAGFERWYDETHIPDMVLSGAMYRGTRFVDCKRQGTEFPRKVPMAQYLTIYETDWRDVRRAYEAVCESLRRREAERKMHPAFQQMFFTMYRRRPEPGQGHLSEKPINGVFLILVRAEPEPFNHWSKFVHLRYIAEAAPGFTMITRYENALSETDGPRYLHLYEMVSDDPQRDTDEMPKNVSRLFGGETPEFWHWRKAPPEAKLDIWCVDTFRR